MKLDFRSFLFDWDKWAGELSKEAIQYQFQCDVMTSDVVRLTVVQGGSLLAMRLK